MSACLEWGTVMDELPQPSSTILQQYPGFGIVNHAEVKPSMVTMFEVLSVPYIGFQKRFPGLESLPQRKKSPLPRSCARGDGRFVRFPAGLRGLPKPNSR